MKPYLQKQYAGNAFISLGLIDAFVAFGLFITRKNNGETHYNWIGADDYMVMSCLMLGGLLTAWSGRSLHRAGDTQYFDDDLDTGYKSYTSPIIARQTTTPPQSNAAIKHMHNLETTACKAALAASLVLSLMCAYAFLGGFHSTPTPNSHIGPRTTSDMQLIVFTLIYGLTASFSIIGTVLSADQLSKNLSQNRPSGP